MFVVWDDLILDKGMSLHQILSWQIFGRNFSVEKLVLQYCLFVSKKQSLPRLVINLSNKQWRGVGSNIARKGSLLRNEALRKRLMLTKVTDKDFCSLS